MDLDEDELKATRKLHGLDKEEFSVHDIVQFNEKHDWTGCLGIITEIKNCGENGIRYMVGVPVPQQRNSLYFCNEYRKCD